MAQMAARPSEMDANGWMRIPGIRWMGIIHHF
jgi:hypothetical protein